MELTSEHKDILKKVISCFKKAGVDVSTISDIKLTDNNVGFSIKVKDKEAIISVDIASGDVYYKYFTSNNKIGNIDDPGALTDVIRKGIEPKKPNGVDESKITQLKEALKKALRKTVMKEMSSTGTGASFNAGQGEQYATPFAFGKKSAINRATKYLIKQGYMKVPDSLRYHAKSFDIEKWK